ncbi:hypothetical protein Tco_0442809 [Tanacetum coccineum]
MSYAKSGSVWDFKDETTSFCVNPGFRCVSHVSNCCASGALVGGGGNGGDSTVAVVVASLVAAVVVEINRRHGTGLALVVFVAALGPKFVLGFAPLESSLSQFVLVYAPLSLHFVSALVHDESVVVHLVSALVHLAIQTI